MTHTDYDPNDVQPGDLIHIRRGPAVTVVAVSGDAIAVRNHDEDYTVPRYDCEPGQYLHRARVFRPIARAVPA